MDNKDELATEADPRFPSGPWLGFFTQPPFPNKFWMELRLNFSDGTLTGQGRDWVGEFLIRGQYDLNDGSCHWVKSYLGKHDVFYKGYNEGKGIWGAWEIAAETETLTGGFYIWPEGMSDPTQQHLTEEADIPLTVEDCEVIEIATLDD